MKKKSKGQLYLERVEMLETIARNKIIERRQWEDLAYNITSNMEGERVKSSSVTTSKMEDAAVKCLMVADEIASAVDNLIAEKQSIVSTIESLHNPTEYRILHMRYIQYIDFEDIASKMKQEYSWVTTTHGRAVRHVEDILNKRKDKEKDDG